MNPLDVLKWFAIFLMVAYMLNQIYIMIKAYRWRSQDKLISRAMGVRNDTQQ